MEGERGKMREGEKERRKEASNQKRKKKKKVSKMLSFQGLCFHQFTLSQTRPVGLVIVFTFEIEHN